jgi:hypothetical protein
LFRGEVLGVMLEQLGILRSQDEQTEYRLAGAVS